MVKEKQKIDLAGEWSDHFDRSIRAESVRAKVILSACYLDELLHQLIEIALKPNSSKEDALLDGPQAPLASFSAKVELTARLGLISEDIKSSLHLVRKIRNEFAHKLANCDFSNDKIASWNNELHKFNDIASEERRAQFSRGPVGDFEKSVSWLVYLLKHQIQNIPTDCPNCGSEMEHRSKLKEKLPN